MGLFCLEVNQTVSVFVPLLQADARRKKQVVTETEREHIMNGKLDDLVEHQRRMDEERDAQVSGMSMAIKFNGSFVQEGREVII